MTLHPAVATLLTDAGLDPQHVEELVRTALAEDLRWGPDITTSATIDPGAGGTADLVARGAGVVAGIPVMLAVLDLAGPSIEGCDVLCPDGSRVAEGQTIATIRGSLATLLTWERTLLNLVTHLSGVATETRRWVEVLAGTGCVLRDTRKTLPGLRALEKYAVRCGGGTNHRMGLGDAALIKDNHVAAAGGIAKAVANVRAAEPDVTLEVECDSLAQVKEALGAGVDLILLDNMRPEEMRIAVAAGANCPGVRFEASGGLTLENVRAAAETGVQYVAVGAVTHSSRALDIGLDLRDERAKPTL